MTVERQNRCAVIKAGRGQILMQERKGDGGYGGSGMAAFGFLPFFGKELRGQVERLEEYTSDILWLIDGESLMQASYMAMHQE